MAVLIRRYTSASSVESREPPLFHPKIPFIGHLLGIMRMQADYLAKLWYLPEFNTIQHTANHTSSENIQAPIFTLKIFSAKIYIITSPELVQAVYRNAKTLSFEPISMSASKRVFQMTDRHFGLLRGSTPSVEDGDEYPVAKATTKIMHATLQPGQPLFDMNARALNKFALFLDDIGVEGQYTDLYEWLKRRFTIATTEALYGPINPISEDESMIQNLMYCLICPAPA